MNWKKWIFPKKQDELTRDEVEFLPAVLEVTETPPSPVGRLLLFSLMVLLAAALLWSFLGHVDEVAVANGKVIPSGQVKVIQAEDKGVIRQIYVQEGQTVKKGDVLVELDRTVSEADLASIRKQIAYYNLEIARLMAQKTGSSFSPPTSPDLDPKDLAAQVSLYQSWLMERQAKLGEGQATIQQSAAAYAAAQANRENYAQQLEVAREMEERSETLYQQNAVAYFQLLEQRAKRKSLEQSVIAQDGEIAKSQATMEESRQRLLNSSASYDKDIDTKLTEDRKQLLQYTEELKKAEDKNRLARIIAPVDGRVGQLSIHTVGGVVTAAQPLMAIVPEDATLEIEAWVANKDIGFVKIGQTAALKVDTFNFQKYGTLSAVVSEISPDAIEDQKDKERDRKYRVVLTMDQGHVLVNDANQPLTPGMTVTAEIKIREKRIMEFFLDPFRKYQSEGLRER
ncbi:MAG: HlyD family type I secretion periplasmic adaptor subunit [Sporomusaceae bacterium]|nr:HlyD family type I secretion periplasmic adaptor subunit [Sporomusaceae bacterium]